MKKTIVIVDDFENTRWVIEFTLQKLNVNILKAASAKEALRFFDGRTVDLLITDLNMPEMDGLQLIEKIRLIPAYQFIPILLLTTETKQEKKDLAKKNRVTGWIQKPFQADNLIAIVKRCIAE